MNDNLNAQYDSNNWSVMNNKMSQFSTLTSINENDFWPEEVECKSLFNAKLFPILNSNLNKEEMDYFRKYFWLDLINSDFVNENTINKWKKSLRYSLEDISPFFNLQKLFQRRRSIFNKININFLANSVVNNHSIKFASIIRNSILDGFAQDILTKFDESNFIFFKDCFKFFFPTLSDIFINIILFD